MNCILAVIIAILFLFPIYWLVAMSFKSDAESFGKIVTYYPHSFTLDPWIQNFTDAEFLKSLKNSMIIALLSMVLSMTFGVPAAYGMGRYRVPGSKGFLLTFLVTQMHLSWTGTRNFFRFGTVYRRDTSPVFQECADCAG